MKYVDLVDIINQKSNESFPDAFYLSELLKELKMSRKEASSYNLHSDTPLLAVIGGRMDTFTNPSPKGIYVLKCIIYIMNLTIKVKLDTSNEQFEALRTTMERFNEACNYIAQIAFEHGKANKIFLHKLVYYNVREKFGLSAQMTVRAVSKTVEAYKRDKTVQPKFREHGAMVYDPRILTWKTLDRVSMLTLEGRIIIPILICDYHKSRLDRIRGQADLILVKGIFYLCVVVDAPELKQIKTTEALGIDLGIVNLAVDSDGQVHSGKGVDTVRGKNAKLKAGLQSARTKSAKCHLKKLSGKVSRFNRDTNHCISKNIVAKAKDTGRAIALEDLEGIRNQITARKAQRGRQHSWGFYQLRRFIEYKSVLAGVPVILVDPRGTSHICPTCGHNEKRNRPTRDKFKCVQCGLAGPADHIAAINIAARAPVNAPIVSSDFFRHSLSPQLQIHAP